MKRKQVHPHIDRLVRWSPVLAIALIGVLFLGELQPLLTRISDILKISPKSAELSVAVVFLIIAVLPILLNRKFPALTAIATVAALVLIFLILFDISSKTVLRRDDYWEIYEARQRGFPGYFQFIFMTNSGRYSAFLIKMLYAVFPPLLWIRITIFLCGVLLLICCFRIAEKLCANRAQSFFLAIVLFSGIYLVQTKIWESFFWGGGGHIYAWGIICALSAWIFLDSALVKNSRRDRIIALVFAFLSSGFAQLINLAMIFLSGTLVLYSVLNNKEISDERRKTALSFFLVLILSTVIAFAMPGNYANAAQFFEDGSSNATLQTAAQTLGGAIVESFLGLLPHLRAQRNVLILLAVVSFLIGLETPRDPSAPNPSLRKAGLGLLSLCAAAFFCPMINGILGYFSTRIFSVPLTMVWLGIAAFTLTAGHAVAARFEIHPIADRIRLPGIFIVACLWLSFYIAERPQLVRIYRTWTARDRELTEIAASGAFSEVEEFETCAVEIMGTDLPDLPYGTYGWVIGRYYGLPPLTAETFCPVP